MAARLRKLQRSLAVSIPQLLLSACRQESPHDGSVAFGGACHECAVAWLTVLAVALGTLRRSANDEHLQQVLVAACGRHHQQCAAILARLEAAQSAERLRRALAPPPAKAPPAAAVASVQAQDAPMPTGSLFT